MFVIFCVFERKRCTFYENRENEQEKPEIPGKLAISIKLRKVVKFYFSQELSRKLYIFEFATKAKTAQQHIFRKLN